MKICLISDEFPIETNFGGISTYQKIISNALSKLGNIVSVICKTYNSEPRTIKFNNVTVHCVPSGNTELEFQTNVLNEMLKIEKDIDIFETADWKGEAYLYLKYYHNKPVIIKLHTPFFVWNKYNQIKPTNEQVKINQREIESIRLADKVYSCSSSLAKIVNESLDYKCPIPVIHNPIELSKTGNCKNLQTSKEDFALFVGSLEARKGVFQLAEALNEYLLSNPNMKFIFIGQDTNRNINAISTKEQIREILNPVLLKRVIFTGHKNEEYINNAYKHAKFAIFPSLYENFPYVLLEAIINMCPVIISKNGGMPEIVDENSSWAVNPYNVSEISQVMNKVTNSNLLHLKSLNAFSKLKVLSDIKIAKSTIDLYRTTIEECKNNVFYCG